MLPTPAAAGDSGLLSEGENASAPSKSCTAVTSTRLQAEGRPLPGVMPHAIVTRVVSSQDAHARRLGVAGVPPQQAGGVVVLVGACAPGRSQMEGHHRGCRGGSQGTPTNTPTPCMRNHQHRAGMLEALQLTGEGPTST